MLLSPYFTFLSKYCVAVDAPRGANGREQGSLTVLAPIQSLTTDLDILFLALISMTDPAVLKRTRAGHRSVATRRVKEVGDVLAASPTPDPVKLDQLRRGLKDTLDTLKRLDADLMPLIDPADVTKEIEDSAKVSDELFAALARVDHALQTKPASAGSTSGTGPTATHAAVHPTVMAKLPKLSLKHFHGTLTGWSPFWDSYKTAIHNNSSLSDTEKFTYLQTLLEGRAREAISGLAITDANYSVAIEILEHRFGDKEKATAAHMEELMSLDSVTSDTHLIELRKLYDKTESSIRSLDALGVKLESYGVLLTPVFVKKLPMEMRLAVSRKVPQKDWTMDKILSVFLEELEARERAALPKGKPVIRRSKEYPTTRAFMGSGQSGCCYCKGEDHGPVNCKRFATVDERKRIIREQGRCFVCLRPGHISRNCRSSAKCGNCNKRHHTSVCFKTSGTESPVDSIKSSSTDVTIRNSTNRGLNPETPPFQSSSMTMTCNTGVGNVVLLQTACTFAFNLNNHRKRVVAHVLLDSGSQCSYITSAICKRLGLKPLGTRSVSIMTFGSRKERLEDCEVVRVGLETKSGKPFEPKLLSVPHICEPLFNAAVDLERYPHLKALDFASDLEHNSQFRPDILLGSDQYWTLLTGELIKSTSGPVALNSQLGWILSGPVTVKEAISQHTALVTHVLRVDGMTESRCLEKELHSFWEIESLGIVEDESLVQTQFEDNVKFENGRYMVSLPWKETCIALPDNYELSLRRLNNLFKRLKRTPDLLMKYDSVIREQLELGVVVPVGDGEGGANRVHYMPHHAVVRQDKTTTKLRVVYDASAKSDGLSLNDCLFVGPSLNKKIFDILLRFRMYPIIIVADIEKAFLMVSVTETDQDALRFL